MVRPGEKQRAATEALVPLVYEELRAIAHAYLRKQPGNFTLRPTEIVNEACLHLLQHARIQWQSPEHFRAVATRKIWQVIVDHLRRRHAQKRGGPAPVDTSGLAEPAPEANAASVPAKAHGRRRIPLESVAVEWRDRTVDLLDLADALDKLAAESQRLRDVIMLHWFGGLTYGEAGRVLGLSGSSVERDFRYALAWLNRRLGGGTADAH